ncbi:hypothetical protein HY772_06645 [Candidatus Woesearchaeota archaeon]|nr:hypothetical protein [Candidatus Woesearchaeota archaeon]
MKNYLIVGMMVLILLISVVQAFQIKSLKTALSGNAVRSTGAGANAGGAANAGGETYEEMMARMHPDQVAAKSGGSGGNSLPTMVGGC